MSQEDQDALAAQWAAQLDEEAGDSADAGAAGGGGGGSDMKGGRDPDEDDRRWARRCVRMANQMMKPATGKKVRR